MKKLIYTLGLIMMFAFTSNSLSAQKFGYVNSIQLLSELPEIASADEVIVAYQQTLIAKGEAMINAFETNYKNYMEQAQSGVLTAIEQQQKEGALAMEQQEIQKYEYQVQELVSKKREETYSPILEKVRIAIEAVGKEQGYTMIFDSSVGGLLSADDSDDIISLVKTKLGI